MSTGASSFSSESTRASWADPRSTSWPSVWNWRCPDRSPSLRVPGMNSYRRAAQVGLLLLVLPAGNGSAQSRPGFRVDETTIAGIHAAFRAGGLTCRALVEKYLARIAAYDKTGPAINALVVVNPRALDVADSLDRRFQSDGLTGPLHCIPTIVKDNFETVDLPVTAGS